MRLMVHTDTMKIDWSCIRLVIFFLCAFAEYSTAQMCSNEAAVHVRLAVTARQNASGHWLVSTSASSDVAKRFGPQIDLEAELQAGCPSRETVIVTAAISTKGDVHLDYEYFPGLGYYKLHTKATDWDQSLSSCEAEGAHLIVLNSEKETSVVRQFFARNPKIEGAYNAVWYHVGFHDKNKEGEYVTVFGGLLASSGYNVWAPDDGQWQRGTNSNCGIIDARLGYATDTCSRKRAYICEKP